MPYLRRVRRTWWRRELPRTRAEAEAQGYEVDTTVYPWLAYMGRREAPVAEVKLFTDLEAKYVTPEITDRKVAAILKHRVGARHKSEVELRHHAADGALLLIARAIGYHRTITAYHKVKKYYSQRRPPVIVVRDEAERQALSGRVDGKMLDELDDLRSIVKMLREELALWLTTHKESKAVRAIAQRYRLQAKLCDLVLTTLQAILANEGEVE